MVRPRVLPYRLHVAGPGLWWIGRIRDRLVPDPSSSAGTEKYKRSLLKNLKAILKVPFLPESLFEILDINPGLFCGSGLRRSGCGLFRSLPGGYGYLGESLCVIPIVTGIAEVRRLPGAVLCNVPKKRSEDNRAISPGRRSRAGWYSSWHLRLRTCTPTCPQKTCHRQMS